MAEMENTTETPRKKKPILVLAILLAGLVVGGYFIAKDRMYFGAPLEPKSVEEFQSNFEEWVESVGPGEKYGGASGKELNPWLREGEILSQTLKNYCENYVSFAKKVNVNNREQLRNFLSLDHTLRDVGGGQIYCYPQGRGMMLADLLTPLGLNVPLDEKQEKRLTGIFDTLCEGVVLLDKVKVDKETENIEGSYQEQQNENIPHGFSVTTLKPEDGTQETVTITVEGKNRGTATVTTKEPKNGVKITGSGSTEAIAQKASSILGELIQLFQDQTLDAATILEFLDEENKAKATTWEGEYKRIVFNWRRFDSYQPLLSQTTFEETGSFTSSNYLFQLQLPVQIRYYKGRETPQIPFYYDGNANQWVSTNATLEAVFNVIRKQKIEAGASQTQIEYPKTDDCYYYYSRKYKVDEFAVEGFDKLETNFSSKVTLVVNDKEISKPVTDGSSLADDLAFVEEVNRSKSTAFTAKRFEYGGCELSPNITYTFFLD